MAGKRKRKSGDAFNECVPVTLEELHFATTVAHAAATSRLPRTSFRGAYEEALETGRVKPGKHLVLADIPENHAAMAIMDAFPDKTVEGEAKRRSLLWRVMFALHEVTSDPRARRYLKKEGNQEFIAQPLMEAVATVPMQLGKPTPVNLVFERAQELWTPEDDE